MEHCKSIRGLERVSEKALDFTATLCRRLARAPLDVASFPVIAAETGPLTVMAPLLLVCSRQCDPLLGRGEKRIPSPIYRRSKLKILLEP